MISRKITSALAWAGLVVVIAVPAADFVLARFGKADAVVVAPTAQPPAKSAAPVEPAVQASKPGAAAVAPKPAPAPAVTVVPAPAPAAVKPAPQPAATDTASETPVAADPVQDYLSTNKALPSYITKGSTTGEPAADTSPFTTTPVATSADVPAAPPAAAPSTAPATVPAAPVKAPVATSIAPAVPTPMAAAERPKPTPRAVTDADLKGWKSGTLEDYLRQHGLLNTTTNSDTGAATN